jgi:hypothetical protein
MHGETVKFNIVHCVHNYTASSSNQHSMHCIFRTPSYVVLTDSKSWMVLPEDGDNERRKASESRSHNLTRCIKLQSNTPNEITHTVFTL